MKKAYISYNNNKYSSSCSSQQQQQQHEQYIHRAEWIWKCFASACDTTTSASVLGRSTKGNDSGSGGGERFYVCFVCVCVCVCATNDIENPCNSIIYRIVESILRPIRPTPFRQLQGKPAITTTTIKEKMMRAHPIMCITNAIYRLISKTKSKNTWHEKKVIDCNVNVIFMHNCRLFSIV